MVKGGVVMQKQEMTKIWVDGKYVPVTLLKFPNQEIIGYRTMERDGYVASILGVNKQTLNKEKGIKVKYEKVCEFRLSDAEAIDVANIGDVNFEDLTDVESINVTGESKGKGFQGVVRKFGFAGGPETHGSKFHRRPGSIGNRKPRRVNKGKKLPGHMGTDTITIKNVKVIDKITVDNEKFFAVKGSVPGGYNSLVKVVL